MKTNRKYDILNFKPVLRCYYTGSHSHPVRRVGLIIEETETHYTVYELREGNEVRPFSKAPIKSYRKDRISKFRNCREKVRRRIPKWKLRRTTMKRAEIPDLVINEI